MKFIFVIIISCSIFFINCTIHKTDKINYLNPENPLINSIWKINGNAFENLQTNIYTLSSPTNDIQFGNFVSFSKDGTFHGYYSAPCGNDCFTTIDGTYHILGKNKISISINEINRSGLCKDESAVLNKNMGTFIMDFQSEQKITLTRYRSKVDLIITKPRCGVDRKHKLCRTKIIYNCPNPITR